MLTRPGYPAHKDPDSVLLTSGATFRLPRYCLPVSAVEVLSSLVQYIPSALVVPGLTSVVPCSRLVKRGFEVTPVST